MKATDLRIGNLVTDKWSVGKYPFKIVSIGKNICHYFGNQEFSAKYEDLEPIPLTEEWLLKFGFEKAKHSHGYDCYIKDGFDFDIVSHGRYWVLAIYTDESCTDSLYFAHGRFEYVHQLQNLYFSITGSELQLVV